MSISGPSTEEPRKSERKDNCGVEQKRVSWNKPGDLMWRGSVGQELHNLEKERAIHTDPEETRRRRTIHLVRTDPNENWGFTLQTYGIRDKKSQHVEVMTYVDYVELHCPAWIAGMRKGDVLLSVNGESVEGLNHTGLVAKIKQCKETLRMVVLFEDCCRKVELYERYIKLKRILSQKMRDLKQLEHEERILNSGDRLSRVGLFRDSLRSSTSSDWDCYSLVASPTVLDSVPVNQRVWRQHFFARSVDTLDSNSELSFDYPSPFGSSKESINGVSAENTSLKDSSSSDGASKPASELPNGACGVEPGKQSSPVTVETKFYLEADGESSDTEMLALRRSKEDEHHPGRRKRSNSTLLTEMRMQLIADAVISQACGATKDLEEDLKEARDEETDGGSEKENTSGAFSESDVTIVVDELNNTCRLYRGVRINDTDEVTRL